MIRRYGPGMVATYVLAVAGLTVLGHGAVDALFIGLFAPASYFTSRMLLQITERI